MMCTIAVIGPDGAGKSVLIEKLPAALPVPVKCLYMGMRLESSNRLLPTTRLLLSFRRARGVEPPAQLGAPPDRPRPDGLLPSLVERLRAILFVLTLFAEEWYRQAVAWIYQRRGYLVLFDRHFLADYYAFSAARYHTFGGNGTGSRPTLGTRIHGFLLKRFYPRPDVVIYLDAPAEVLLRRKGEGTLDQIEHMQRAYLQFSSEIEHFVHVDASKSEDEVLDEAVRIIQGLYVRSNVVHD